MRKVNGYFELSKLNSEIAGASRRDLEVALSIAVGKWENCLKRVKKLQQYEPLSYDRQYLDKRESPRVTWKAVPYKTSSSPEK